MRRSYPVALGGVLAALAVVIMTLGGLIPIATYVSPMLCGVLLLFVKQSCGNTIGWTWYGAVSVLSLLLSPDKEAAAVFLALGYYPIIQPALDKSRLKWLWKFLFFNLVSAVLYMALIYLFGMAQVMSEFQEIGRIGLVITLVLGNISFILLDRLLHLVTLKFYRKAGAVSI